MFDYERVHSYRTNQTPCGLMLETATMTGLDMCNRYMRIIPARCIHSSSFPRRSRCLRASQDSIHVSTLRRTPEPSTSSQTKVNYSMPSEVGDQAPMNRGNDEPRAVDARTTVFTRCAERSVYRLRSFAGCTRSLRRCRCCSYA